MTKQVTAKQHAVLQCIYEYTREKGYGPSVRELGTMLGLASPSTIHSHLKSLEAKGMIRHDSLKSRALVLTEAAVVRFADERAGSVARVPIVRDAAACEEAFGAAAGEREGTGEGAGWLSVPAEVLGGAAGCALAVADGCDVPDFRAGDLVVIRQQDAVEAGHVALVRMGGAAGLQRIEDAAAPVDVIGCAVALFRRL